MILEEKFKIQSKDIGKGCLVKNRGILEILENIATHHSDKVGYGPNNVEETNIAWILIDWKIKVLKRPKYGETFNVKTWGRTINGELKKTYTYRDFEIYDKQKNLCVIGTSKWVIMNTKTGKIMKIENEIMDKYGIEDKDVFNIGELERIKVPKEFSREISYKVSRRDIDLNQHMHNLYYLDLAYEVLPEDVYEQRPFDEFRINYKREIKLGDKIKCKYTFENGKHVVVVCDFENENIINAIIILK